MFELLRKVWGDFSDLGVSAQVTPEEAKRTRLTNRITLLGSLLMISHLLHYASEGLWLIFGIQFLTVCTILSAPLLNYLNRPTWARMSMLTSATISALFTSSLLGFESGEHLAFFVILLMAMGVFGLQHWPWLAVIFGLILTCYCLLEGTGYQLWGLGKLPMPEGHETYVVNFVITLVLCGLIGLHFQQLSGAQVGEISRRARRQLQAAFDNSYDAMFLADIQDFRITESNARGRDMFDAADKLDFRGRRIAELKLIPFTPAELEDIRSQLENHKEYVLEFECLSFRQRIFWGAAAFTLFQYDDHTLLMLRVTDISERKAVEAEMLKARQRAESANIAKAHFLANMSHEIRTPINGVIGLAEVIQSEYEDASLQQYADFILESGQRLLRTISAILDLSRLESEAEILLSDTDMHQLLVLVAKPYQTQAEAQGLYFRIESAPGQYIAHTDPALIQKVLDHLISNAVKFTKQGGITLRCDISPLPESGPPQLVVSVADTGIGMSQQFIESKLFQKFEQESTGLDRNFEGAGLGLSITKRIVEVLDGRIEVSSVQHQGSVFTLRLPLARFFHPASSQQ
ncbi:MAG: HAMP domain-containing sensor histidine kinase [Bacteroidia bacterium]|nr:HAMP domain-containing sensor histidine kinase [Bacteroidia bacterium]